MEKVDIVRILMRRDGMTLDEAWNVVRECQQAIDDLLSCGTLETAEDVIKDYLGLEPDYLEAFLF